MQMIKTVFAVLVGSGLLASAVAVPQGGPIAGSITLYTDPNYGGSSTTLLTPVGQCITFPDGFHDDVSSVSPLQTWTCTLFFDDACTASDGSLVVTQPVASLTYGDNAFNSVSCTPDNA